MTRHPAPTSYHPDFPHEQPGPSVVVTVTAGRYADLEPAALATAAPAFESYQPAGRWVARDGRPLIARLEGDVTPASTQAGRVTAWEATYRVGPTPADH